MCFSAQASFSAAGILSIIGIFSLKKVKQKKFYPFAIVPLLFAIQQAFEGIVWITYQNSHQDFINTIAMYGFLFFAFFFWPIWIPYSLILVEKKTKQRNILYALLGVGFAVSTGLIWSVIQHGVGAQISCSHIKYNIEIPSTFHEWGVWAYCLATVLPFFVSSKKFAWVFGFLICGSVALTLYAYAAYFTSVWCFFAAILSTVIYFYI